MESTSEKASAFLGKAKHWIDEKRSGVTDYIQEERVKKALGRPVTRVILAPDDTIILNLGELVTHKAVEMTRDAGVLDVLVSSVDTKAGSFDPKESRPDGWVARRCPNPTRKGLRAVDLRAPD